MFQLGFGVGPVMQYMQIGLCRVLSVLGNVLMCW